MASSYPGTLDSLATTKADATATPTDHPAHHNDLADAVNKIEAELGTDPSSTSATVRARFEESDLKQSCKAATTAALPAATYANGTSGVGATLTATANAALAAQDGVTLAAADRLLVKDQAAPLQNGVYTVTQVGSAGAPWILTRAIDADTAAKLNDTALVTVEQGTTQRDSGWALVSDNPITVGTTAIRITKQWPAYGTNASMPASGLWLPTGVKLENPPRHTVSLGDRAHLTSGVLRLAALGVLRAGDSLASVKIWSGATAGATLTNRWAGIVRVSDRQLMAVSANDTSASWAASTAQTFTFASSYTADKDELFWTCLNVTGTTMPTLLGVTTTNNALADTPVIAGNSNTALTTPLAVGTIVTAATAGSALFYSSAA